MSDLTLKRKVDPEWTEESDTEEEEIVMPPTKEEKDKFNSLTLNQKLIMVTKRMEKQARNYLTACENMIQHLKDTEYTETVTKNPGSGKKFKRIIIHSAVDSAVDRIFTGVDTEAIASISDELCRLSQANDIHLYSGDLPFLKEM